MPCLPRSAGSLPNTRSPVTSRWRSAWPAASAPAWAAPIPQKAGGYKRACKEGPVFDSREIDWSERVVLPVSANKKVEVTIRCGMRSHASNRTIHPNPDLSVDFAGIRLKNPVLTASGTFGYGEEFSDFVDLNKLGGIIVKGISLEADQGQSSAPDLGDARRHAECHRPGESRRRCVPQRQTSLPQEVRYRGDREHVRVQRSRTMSRSRSGSTARRV